MTHSNHRPDSHGPNELQEVQMKANCLIDDSLESTRRMLALCEEVRVNKTYYNPYVFLT